MKKKLYIAAVSFFVLIMAFVMSGCGKNKLYDIERDITPAENIVCVTEKEKYSTDDTVIRYSITNVGDEDGAVNGDVNCFELHKLVDNEWKRVGTMKEHYWTELALIYRQSKPKHVKLILTSIFICRLKKANTE